MNGTERNRFDNYNSIISLLLDNKEIISTVRAFSYSTSKLCSIIETIKKQERTLKSEQSQKIFRTSRSKDNLIFSLVPFAAALYSYGKRAGDNQLCIKYSRITQNYLMMLTDNELLNKAISINIAVEKHLTGLKEFNITNRDLKMLKCRIEDFKYTMSYHLEAGCFFSPAEISMDTLFLEADKLLCSMDSFMETLGVIYSGFYAKYLVVRNSSGEITKRNLNRYTS